MTLIVSKKETCATVSLIEILQYHIGFNEENCQIVHDTSMQYKTTAPKCNIVE